MQFSTEAVAISSNMTNNLQALSAPWFVFHAE